MLWEQLQLELAMDKTQITHVTEGFDFLGFHLQWNSRSKVNLGYA